MGAGEYRSVLALVRVKANKALASAKDPREVLAHSYQRRNEMLVKVRRGLADVATSCKRLDLHCVQLTQTAYWLQVSVDVPELGCVVLRPDGDIDNQTAPALREALSNALSAGAQTIVVDLDAVTFLGATGVDVLLDGYREGLDLCVNLVLAGGRRVALRALQVTCVIDVIGHYDSVDRALTASSGTPE